MRLNTLHNLISGDICDALIPYNCKSICYGLLERNKNMLAVWTWYSCRDVFHDDFPTFNHIFIYHKNYSGKRLYNFIINVEDRLGLKNKTKYYKTCKKHASLFILSKFWDEEMKLSLLTLLIRYAVKEKRLKFDEKKNIKCDMIKDTIGAILYFLEGNTEYTGIKSGWHEQFCNIEPDLLQNLLIRCI